MVFPLLTGDFKVKTFSKLPEPPQLFPPEKRWTTAHSCNGTVVIMCSYQPITGQYYQVSKAKYILATLSKSAPVQQIISNTTMRKRKETNCKIPGFFEWRNAGMLHSPRWSSVEVCLSIRSSRDPGANNYFFFLWSRPEKLLEVTVCIQVSMEHRGRNQVKARGKREINCWLVHPITNI